MRREFDGTFALPAVTAADPGELLLGVGVAGAPFALRLEGLVAIADHARVTKLRTGRGGALGVSNFRGAIVPVFDLAWFLERQEPAPAAYLAIADRSDPIAFAFHTLDGCWRAAPEHRRAAVESVDWIVETVQLGRQARPVIAPSVLARAIRTSRGGEVRANP
jgi:purine-binding chemotaxis protein CheW